MYTTKQNCTESIIQLGMNFALKKIAFSLILFVIPLDSALFPEVSQRTLHTTIQETEYPRICSHPSTDLTLIFMTVWKMRYLPGSPDENHWSLKEHECSFSVFQLLK